MPDGTKFVALLRGINVGGKHSLPMQDLRDVLTSLGCENVSTYIQSGNAVFFADADSDSLSAQIAAAIELQFGFAPQVLLLSAEKFKAIATANPYPEFEKTPRLLHVSFLTTAPTKPNVDALQELKLASESFSLSDDAFYLCAPEGISRSKLAGAVERHLGVAATARNWRTVSKLLALTV